MNIVSNELLERAKGIKILFLDVDGVLTDGSLYFNENGESLKKFNALDGYGINLLLQSDIEPVVITGRNSKSLRKRLSELCIKKSFYGVENKLQVAEHCLKEAGLNWSQAAGMGDDWPDLPILMRVKLSIAPALAHIELLNRVNLVCKASAGSGAVREACDILLMANGYYAKVLNKILI